MSGVSARALVGRSSNAYAAEMDEILWECDVCKTAVEGHAGSLWVSMAGVAEAEAERRRWEADNPGPVYTGADLLHLPTRAHWRVTHHVCAGATASAYEIGLHRIQTFGHVVNWTAHLMGKSWLSHTDWEYLLGRLAPDTP